MTTKRGFSVGVAVITVGLGLLLSAPTAQATTYYWTTSTGGIYGGSGTWSTSSADWNTSTAGGSSNSSWTNSATNSVDFYANSPAGGSTITVSGSVVVDNITFAGSGYTLTGGSLGLQSNSVITANQNATIASDISSGAVTSAGAATLILAGNNGYTGATTISGGTLQLGIGGTTGSVGSSSISDSGVLAINHSGSFTIAVPITGTGSLVQAGTNTTSNTLILTGNDTYTGTTTISAGTLQLGQGLAAGAITGGGNVTDNGVLIFYSSGNKTFTSAISGSGGLIQKDGDLIFTANNTYTGTTTVTAGTLQLNNNDSGSTVYVNTNNGLAFGVTALTIGGLAGGGMVNLATTGTSPSPVTLSVDGNNSIATYSGVLSGGGGLTQAGTGTQILTGANTYTGATTISAGTLQLGSGGTAGSIGSTSSISDNSVLAFDFSSNATFSQAVTGSGSLVQMGAGGLILTGANAYSGGATVKAGDLQFSGNSAVPSSGTITINNGGALVLASTGTYSTVDGWLGSHKIAPASAGALALLANDSELISMAGYPSLSLGASGNVTFNGTLTPAGTTYNLGGGGGTLTFTPTITGVASLNVSGPGNVVLAGAESYSGPTTVSGGTLAGGTVGSGLPGSLSAASPLTVASGASLDLAGLAQTILSLSGGGTVINRGGATTLTLVPAGGSTTFSGVIQSSTGQTSLTLDGAGTEILTGSNTYSGLTTIAAGTLQLGSGGATGSIGSTSGVTDNGLLSFDNSGTTSFGPTNGISGSGSLIQNAGTLILNSANTYSGTTALSGGTLELNNTKAAQDSALTLSGGSLTFGVSSMTIGGLGGSVNVALATTGGSPLALTVSGNSSPATYSGILSGGGSLTLAGTSDLTLTGSNTYTGGTTINSGDTLQLGSGGTTGSINSSSLIADNGVLDFDLSGSTTFASAISGTGGVTQMSLGVLRLSSIGNTYSGPTSVSSGTIVGGDLSSSTSVQVASGAVFDLDGVPQTVGSLSNLNGSSGTVTSSVAGLTTLTLAPPGGSTTFGGVIQNGHGTVALVMSGSGTQVLAGNNTYSGGTTVQGGVLSVSNDYNLGATAGALTLSGGTFQASPSFTLNSSRPVSVGAATISVPSGTLIYAGAIANAGATPGTLTKTGSGVLQLDGANTYSGATAVALGTLAGAGTVANTVTVNAGAHIAPGDNTSGNFGGVGTLTLGGLTLNTNAQIDLDLGTTSDLLAVSGVLTVGNAFVNIQNSGGLTSGTYEVMSYGSLVGNASALLANNLPAGFSGVFFNNASKDQIDVDLYGGTKAWTGSHSSSWDATTSNWSLSLSATTFSNGDPIIFTDAASTGSVSLAGTVSPFILVVSNNTLPYNFSGNGSIAGSVTLTKENSGTLAVAMTGNTYSGGTNLASGVLQIGASSVIAGGTLASGPLGVGTLNIFGGTLQDGGAGYTLANAVDISGNVTLGSAGVGGLTLGPQGLSTPNTVTLTGSPTLYVTAPTTIADPITGALVKDGPSTLTLTAATNNFSVPPLVDDGTLAGTVANLGPVTVASGGNVTIYQTASGTLNNVVSGAGSLTSAGPGTLTIGVPQQYTGTTIVNAGTLKLNAPIITLPLMSYNFNGVSGGTLANGQAITDVTQNGYTMYAYLDGGTASYAAGPLPQLPSAVSLANQAFVYTGPLSNSNNGNGNTTVGPALPALNTWTVNMWFEMPLSTVSGTNIASLVSTRWGGSTGWGSGSYLWYTPAGVAGAQSNGFTAALNTANGAACYNSEAPYTVAPNTWYMLTQTIQGQTYDLYIDSQLVGSYTLNGNTPLFAQPTADLTLGWDNGINPGNMINPNVTLGYFSLYNTAIPAAQVAQLYIGEVASFNAGLSSTTPVQVAYGATFDLNGLNQTINSLANSGASGGTVTTSVAIGYAPVVLTLAPAGTSTFSGVIQDGAGQIAVIANGPGLQVFAGSNTYSGPTTVNNCSLEITGSGSYSGGFVINSGTLEIGGPGVLDNALANGCTLTATTTGSGVVMLVPGGSMFAPNFTNNVVVAGGTLNGSPNGTETAGVLVSSGLVSVVDGQTLFVGANGLLVGSGTVNLSGGTLVQGDAGGVNGYGGVISVGDPGGGGNGRPAVLNISGDGQLVAGNSSTGYGAGLQVGVGGATGIVNQYGGTVGMVGNYFSVGGALVPATAAGTAGGTGTYNLYNGALSIGYNGISGGIAAIGVSGGTGTMNVRGGLCTVAADTYGATLDIGSRGGNGTLNISGGTVDTFAGITIGNVYGRAGSVGTLVLQGGLLDLASNGYGSAAGQILVGSGGSLVATSGTLQNVSEIWGNATITGSGFNAIVSGTPMPLTMSGTGVLVLAGYNNYSAGTTILSGTVDFSTPESVPTSSTGRLDIESGGEVVFGALLDSGGDSEPAVTAAADSTSSSVVHAASVLDSLLARLRAERAGESGHGSAVGSAGVVTAAVSPAVPEPSTIVLLAAAALGLLGCLWRRKRT